MIRFILYLCFFLLALLSSCTPKTVDKNTATNDSIKKFLVIAGNDTLDYKIRNKYNDKAFSLVDLNKNDTLTRFYLSSISFNYMKTKAIKNYKHIAKIHFKKSIIAKDTLNLARYYRSKAVYYRKIQVPDSAFYYYIKAEKFYKKTSDEFGLAKVYYYKSGVQATVDDYLGAELSANLAYNYCKNKSVNKFTLDVLMMQGLITNNLKNYDNAIKIYKKCISKIPKNNFKEGLSYNRICLNNIGNAYREQKMYNRAIYYFKLVLKDDQLKEKDPELYGLLLNNIGFCYMQLNNNNNLPDLFFRASRILDSIGNKNECAVSNLFISQFYFKKKDTLKAQLYADVALKITKKTHAPYYYLTALSNAGSVNSKMAPKYIKEYHEKNDSLLFIERNARNQYYRIQLETDEIKEEKNTAIKQKWLFLGVSGVVILIIVLLLIITKQRSKQKELQFLQSQQQANEEIYDLMLTQKNKEEQARQSEKKRIALELHDGVMNKLASTRMNLNRLLSHQKDEEAINKCLTHIEGIHKIEQEIRSIAHNLNQEVFNDDNSVISLLNDFVATQNSITSTHYQIEIDKAIDWNAISSGIKMNIYRIVQEASHNSNKYAQAPNVTISLILDEDNICLSVTDNGKGFDTEKQTEGIGLKNIQQRVETLHGKFVIQSTNNKSTSLNIAIPLK